MNIYIDKFFEIVEYQIKNNTLDFQCLKRADNPHRRHLHWPGLIAYELKSKEEDVKKALIDAGWLVNGKVILPKMHEIKLVRMIYRDLID